MSASAVASRVRVPFSCPQESRKDRSGAILFAFREDLTDGELDQRVGYTELSKPVLDAKGAPFLVLGRGAGVFAGESAVVEIAVFFQEIDGDADLVFAITGALHLSRELEDTVRTPAEPKEREVSRLLAGPRGFAVAIGLS